MKKNTSLVMSYRQMLDTLIEDDARYETIKRILIQLLVFGIVAFVAWAIYFIHIIQNYRLTPITLR